MNWSPGRPEKARIAWDTKIKEQLQAARQLCRNESARNQMLESQRTYIFPGTCDRIVEKIMEISEVP